MTSLISKLEYKLRPYYGFTTETICIFSIFFFSHLFNFWFRVVDEADLYAHLYAPFRYKKTCTQTNIKKNRKETQKNTYLTSD